MTEETAEDTTTDRSTARIEDVDDSWLLLQRVVAVGMIVVLATPMVVVLRQFIPPLAVATTLFAVALALTWFRPRAGAIGVGVLAGLWLLLQLANLSMVIPDLTRPSATLFFLITLGMIAFGVAGLVGLVGVLRRGSGRIAVRTVQLLAAVMLAGGALSLLTRL